MDTDSAAVISLESDEEMDTVAAPEAPNSTVTGEEPEQEASNNVENDSAPLKSPDNAKTDSNDGGSDIILIDDEEKESSETSEQKSSENLLPPTEPAVENQIESEAQTATTATTENEDVEMKEIAKEDEEKVSDCPQPVPEEEQKPEEMEPAQSTAILEPDKKDSAGIETTTQSIQETKEPVLSKEAEPVKKLQHNSNRREQKCGNPGCVKKELELIEAPIFAQSLYSMPPDKQTQLICPDCFQYSVNHYESLCASLTNEESLYRRELLQDKVEEIHTVLDSSDEETDEPSESESKAVEAVLPEEAISLVDKNLNEVINALWKEYGEKHITMFQMDMVREMKRNEATSERIDLQLKRLKATLRGVHENIYSVRTTKIDTPELIVEDDTTSERIAYQRIRDMLERNEPLVRHPVKLNDIYYGVQSTILGSWVKCKVMNISENNVYSVRFLVGNNKQTVLSAKHLAYTEIPWVKLKLGTRVIAKVCSTTGEAASRAFYAGTVLESISSYNKFRYLIIFDSGHTLYAPLQEVRVVCEESKHVWDDVHPHSKEFIRNYMQTCGSMRPMVQAQPGQRLMVEINQKWYQGKVIETDSSLFKLYFQEINRYEWIYRGSKRLAPLYSRGTPNNKFSKFQRRNEPSIEYITIEDDSAKAPAQQDKPQPSQSGAKQESQDTQVRATAKKSTAHRHSNSGNKNANANGTATTTTNNNNNVPGVISLNRNTIYIDFDKNRSTGKTLNYTTKNYRAPQKFVPHVCGPSCVYKIPKTMRMYNLLARPLITGWEREFCHYRGPKKNTVVMYRAPCGRRIRDMPELHRYLRATGCSLNVECFDFESDIRALATFCAQNVHFECKDLSFGAEPMPVHCVNNYDDTQPPPCEYSTERIPTEGVNLNLDKEFLCGCDCEDDCADKSKCQCWQLTITGARFTNPYVDPNTVGYVYKRLLDPVLTGIYECNVQCKCRKDACLNRVVQNSLQTKLQVFNTHNKGWGIRCLNDVPKGSFICIYAGHLLTEDTSNKICELSENKTGDEYFADLDYIENAENHKADYEAEAYRSDNEDSVQTDNPDDSDESADDVGGERFASTQDSDEEYTSKTKPSTMVVKTRAQSRKASTTERTAASAPSIIGKVSNNGVNDEQECVSLIPNPEMNPKGASITADQESTLRKFFGENEHIYVMDAKKSGNLGRYFNHSCVPNLFVQSVFVDTHDVRFPWVAFFAYCNIKAGTELTWNYNYDVGSVNGKVLTCVCGERGCKGRLL
ncbi:histone-lysine N-methyltransferase eggless isoform X1 [Anopheles stephensi]|uniref:histone-lysine N-methyltransferase eggless isoform X1 n=1 Tax=Anopheles stephensi TaxID=30069 RepID=UPI00165898AA|nr:histone-lysine N-methyltransferase eggless isoform X1 [Anopheles stephensi]